jgi:hypothetical protein
MTRLPSGALHVFVGPTLLGSRVRSLAPGATVHPPVRHGDLLGLAPRPGDTVVLIDGLWHQAPPVRHKEILELLASGVAVVGAASMGALRAAELAPYGMVGVGWVYQQYVTGRIDADDEVAVTQTPDGQPLSTALVCLRYVLAGAVEAGAITGHDADRLLELARAMPYQRRSWRALEHAASGRLTDPCRRVAVWRDQHGQANIKSADAELAVQLAAAGQVPQTTALPGWRDEPWRTSHVRSWAATFRPAATADGAQVPLLAVLHHAQLYDPRWPQRWRRHVLAWIASIPSSTATTIPRSALEDQALAAAHDRGLDLNSLTPTQIEHWATHAEIIGLCPRELLLQIITRSARLDPTANVCRRPPPRPAGYSTWKQAPMRPSAPRPPTSASLRPGLAAPPITWTPTGSVHNWPHGGTSTRPTRRR